MFTEIYLEALLANENLADEVMELLESGQIDLETAIFEWAMIPIREVSKASGSGLGY
jgi:hypothetical protein